MKKIMIVLMCLITLNGFGQDGVEKNLKPQSGVTLDVNFNPFGGANVIGINSLNMRFFASPNMAIRLGIGLDYNQDKYDNLLSGDDMYIAKSSTLLLGLRPGLEKHFVGTERLSPYIGAELVIEMFGANAKIEDGSDILEISGATDEELTNMNYTQLGLGLIAGTDFYFSKNIYLGVEVGFGFRHKSYGEVEISDGTTTVSLTEGKSTNLSFGQYFKPSLKLGWRF
jgi:hypothetical protein